MKMTTTITETPNALDFSKSSSMKSSITESNVLLDILLIDFFLSVFPPRVASNVSSYSVTFICSFSFSKLVLSCWVSSKKLMTVSAVSTVDVLLDSFSLWLDLDRFCPDSERCELLLDTFDSDRHDLDFDTLDNDCNRQVID